MWTSINGQPDSILATSNLVSYNNNMGSYVNPRATITEQAINLMLRKPTLQDTYQTN